MANTIYPLAGQLGVDMLLPASFRGIAFDCLYTREVLARDTGVYEYPCRDGAEVEDHGLKALNLRLSALFWGNGYQRRLKVFLAALKAPGLGELLHPVYGLAGARAAAGSGTQGNLADNTPGTLLDACSMMATSLPVLRRRWCTPNG
ncbi:MAG: DNA circularization N-terminal domain-containing protein [Sodalis sp. (in: enterobacteria)]|uniref:DNA circularization N-terminal domain-containing protein n=1 Tax=Sodalis sp. (in: enterobacteria) TaxID=1898979 RepID=UPI003F2D9C55